MSKTEKLTVLVSGASRRLGLFLCEKFAANDCEVIALTRRVSSELKALSIAKNIHLLETKTYAQEDLQVAIEHVLKEFSHLDLLIHNASIFEKDGSRFNGQHFHDMFAIHMAVPAQLNMGLKSLLYNENAPGIIVHMTDIYAEVPNPDYALYCSTKAGLESLSKSYAMKFAPGVRVNSIQPGPIQFLPSHTQEAKDKVLSETLLEVEGGFMPVFQAICSIVENPYITGTHIKVDGGRSLGRGQSKAL